MNLNWFKKGVIYQIYPRSFKDSNADGIGDLKGITSKLDYIKSLNVDIIWISPIFKSPNKDNGYDVSDYCAIMPEFGTMSDFDELLKEAHRRDLKIVLDLVPNHTSEEHPWFEEAKKSKNNPYRDYYIWRKPKPDGSPPNNWPSFFGGSAWTFDDNTGEYYLHLFTKHQPDLNWKNSKVREEIYQIMRFWLDKGIDGFRMDVVTLLSKNLSFKDIDLNIGFRKIIENHYANGPKIHEYLNEMHEKVMKHYDAFSMGEGVGVTQDNAHFYVGKDRNELDMIYHFDILENNIVNGKYEDISEFDLINVKKIFRGWQKVMTKGGWIANALGNHDFARLVSRFGNDKKYHKESAKMLITLMVTQNGTLNIYQGDEIGMTNIQLNDIEEINDVQSRNFYFENLKTQKFSKEMALKMINKEGRDNARTPMQWSNDMCAGFSNSQPWIQVNPNYKNINVQQQLSDSESILNYYKSILKLKKSHNVFSFGKFEEFEKNNKNIYAYTKRIDYQEIIVFLNFSEFENIIDYHFNKAKNYDILINNYSFVTKTLENIKLQPYQSIVFNVN